MTTEKGASFCGGSSTSRSHHAPAAWRHFRPASADQDATGKAAQPRIPANPDPVVFTHGGGFFLRLPRSDLRSEFLNGSKGYVIIRATSERRIVCDSPLSPAITRYPAA